ncbi:MAG: HAMP domain-containing sensor histidine kinase [Bacteroidota bacterium]
MRLITKATLLYLFIMSLVFGAAGFITYNMVMKVVAKETDYSLAQNMFILKDAIAAGKPIDALQNQKTQITKVTNIVPKDTTYQFTDTLAMHPFFKRLEPHRKLTITQLINGEYYRFKMIDIFLETDDVSGGVVSVMSQLFLGLGLTLLVCSFLISSWLFQPFQKTLQKIATFNLKKSKALSLSQTSTKEFKELNEFITTMTDKASRDYITLKEFSENAAHEMQTPIAVAKGKLELLLESPDLSEKQLPLIQSAQAALSKLSRLGQSLSLLTKIENNEFTSREITNFSEVVEQSALIFKDICDLKGLQMQRAISPNISLAINASVADILVSNLIKNAVRYNVPDGWVNIQLDKKQLVVRNPGEAPKVPTQQLFERFRKSNQSGESLGLGLAIVKKICDVNRLKVNYIFEEGVHQLTVTFP